MAKPKLTEKQKKELIKKYGHIPTKEEIFEKILASQEQMAKALKGAWDKAPNDPKIREQLLEVGARSAKLKKALEKLFSKSKSK